MSSRMVNSASIFCQSSRNRCPLSCPPPLSPGTPEVHQQIRALQGPRRARLLSAPPAGCSRTAAHRGNRPHRMRWKKNSCGNSRRSNVRVAMDALDLFSRSSDRLARQNRIRELVKKSNERPSLLPPSRANSMSREEPSFAICRN